LLGDQYQPQGSSDNFSDVSSHHGPCQTICPLLEPNILEKCAELSKKKEAAVRTLVHASGVVSRLETQIAMRRRRMKAIKKLNSGFNVRIDLNTVFMKSKLTKWKATAS